MWSLSCLKTPEELPRFWMCVLSMCVCMRLASHHMLGDRVWIGEGDSKINDLRSECIAEFTHWGRWAKYSSSSPSHCIIMLQGKGLIRDTRRPKVANLFINSIQPCFRVNLDFHLSFLSVFFSALLTCLYIFIRTGPPDRQPRLNIPSTYKLMRNLGVS